MQQALAMLATQLSIVAQSPLLRTAPLGFTDQPDFLNTAVLAETTEPLDTLKIRLHAIEDLLGRVRTVNKNGPRTMDLDVLVYDGQVLDQEIYQVDYLRSEVQFLAPELLAGQIEVQAALSPLAEQFKLVLDQVFAAIQDEPWYAKATNYSVTINDTDAPRQGNTYTLATTTRGGYVPTVITYYVRNFQQITFEELYRVTKHEFAHLWTLGEADAQAVE